MPCSIEDTNAVTAQTLALQNLQLHLEDKVWTGEKKSMGTPAVLWGTVISERWAGVCLMHLCPQPPAQRQAHHRCFVNTLT